LGGEAERNPPEHATTHPARQIVKKWPTLHWCEAPPCGFHRSGASSLTAHAVHVLSVTRATNATRVPVISHNTLRRLGTASIGIGCPQGGGSAPGQFPNWCSRSCSDQIPRLVTRARRRRIQLGDGSVNISSVMPHAKFAEGFGSCDRRAANLRLNE